MTTLQFLGAAGTVTGSKFLVEHGKERFLFDCGLFQGLKPLRLRNWADFPVDPKSLTAVVLTHAHMDHTGYLPRLVRAGFSGPIFCSEGTQDLCDILLKDGARIQEEDAFYANKKGFSKHHPALPLYTQEDAQAALKLFQEVAFGQNQKIGGLTFNYHPAGHILSAASIAAHFNQGPSVLFSGDLGRNQDWITPKPQMPTEADYVVMESTYGDRQHDNGDPLDLLHGVLQKIVHEKAVLLIPAFALGRAQTLLYGFYRLFEKNPHLKIPLFLDSPMAVDITKLYYIHRHLHRLDEATVRAMCQATKFLHSSEESRQLNDRQGPMIIIAASGMLTGGRILHHLKFHGQNARNRILLVGFQAPGTRGADLVSGVRMLKIHGQMVSIAAQVEKFDAFSAHADQSELRNWASGIGPSTKKVFLVHGEDLPRKTLAAELLKMNLRVEMPNHEEKVAL